MISVDLERVELLAALVSSGGASEEEVLELGNLVSSSSEAQAIAHSFDETMGEIAMDLEWLAPPPGGLQSLQKAIAATDSGQDSTPPSIAAPSNGSDSQASGDSNVISLAEHAATKSKSNKIFIASSVLFLSAAAAMGVMWTQEKKRNDALSRRVDVLKTDLVSVDEEWNQRLSNYRTKSETKLARLEMLRSPSLSLATLGAESGGTIKIFMEPEGKRWLVYGFDLPNEPDKDYQFWFVPAEGAPIPAGIFSPLGDGIHELEVLLPDNISNITQAAVSLEPKGGSDSPTEVQMIGPI